MRKTLKNRLVLQECIKAQREQIETLEQVPVGPRGRAEIGFVLAAMQETAGKLEAVLRG